MNENNNGWIPCSERMPETKEVYLDALDIVCKVSDFVWVTLEDEEVIQANLEEGKWYCVSGLPVEKTVIAWQPYNKPEPYRLE